MLCAGTGIVYAWMLYFCEPEDPFALANHPWQTQVKAAHILTAPLVVFALGAIWRLHVWQRIRTGFRARRKTGWILFLAAAPMVISGYGLQVAADELWREIWLWTHWLASAAWVVGYGIHQLAPRARSATRQS